LISSNLFENFTITLGEEVLPAAWLTFGKDWCK